MLSTYRTEQFSFAYPSTWEIAEQASGHDLAVTVASEGSAFCTISLLAGRPTVKSVLDAALDAYRESYNDCDSYPVHERICSRQAKGLDVDFYYLELINSAWLRAFRTPRFTVLVLFQAGFDELPAARAVFEQICGSLECDAPARVDE
jgi:hypothetical protein